MAETVGDLKPCPANLAQLSKSQKDNMETTFCAYADLDFALTKSQKNHDTTKEQADLLEMYISQGVTQILIDKLPFKGKDEFMKILVKHNPEHPDHSESGEELQEQSDNEEGETAQNSDHPKSAAESQEQNDDEESETAQKDDAYAPTTMDISTPATPQLQV